MAIPSITRENVLTFRQRATYLHRRLPPRRLVEAAFAGLQDSAPRSAVLALHARVSDVSPSAWKDPRFVQVWGPIRVRDSARQGKGPWRLGVSKPSDTG